MSSDNRVLHTPAYQEERISAINNAPRASRQALRIGPKVAEVERRQIGRFLERRS
jgi:hypothetical protein